MRAGRRQRARASSRRMHHWFLLQGQEERHGDHTDVPYGRMTMPGSPGFTHALEAGEVVPVPGQGEAKRRRALSWEGVCRWRRGGVPQRHLTEKGMLCDCADCSYAGRVCCSAV